jgi:hypothetical protein
MSIGCVPEKLWRNQPTTGLDSASGRKEGAKSWSFGTDLVFEEPKCFFKNRVRAESIA